MKINNVLAIAITEYDDLELNKIQNCHNDVSSIIKVLTEKYSIDNVELIAEKAQTTRKLLYNRLNEYFTNCLDNENVLLIYAGHGEYNEKLNTAYWQPSDADPNDSSTWLNINEIMSFLKASNAFHIGVISDSCYSGAIFEPGYRGGGIDAFNSKKSRLGLTSGGIEKVSDGKTGELSPFADLLVKTLYENEEDVLPFNILGSKLIMEFNSEREQTPMFAPLRNVGHEGGSFLFKLKQKANKNLNIVNINQFLEEKLENLFIPISNSDLKIIAKIKPIIELKAKFIKEQTFEKAAEYRDKEKSLEKVIKSNLPEYIDSFFSKTPYSTSEIRKSNELDEEIVKYTEEIKKEKDKPSEEKIIAKYEKEISKGASIFKQQRSSSELWKLFFKYQEPSNPAETLFISEEKSFLKAYKDNIIDIYKHIDRVKCTSKSDFLNKKIAELKEILINIYDYEIDLLIKGYRNELDEIMTIKKLDIKVLNWIKHK